MARSAGCLCDGVGMTCESFRSGLCGQVKQATFQQLSMSAHIEEYPAGRIIWHDDDAPSVVGINLSGLLRFERCTMHGRRQVLNLILPGELVGCEVPREAGYTIEAATPVTICRFDAATFDRVITEDEGLRKAIYRQNTDRLERLRWLTWAIGALSPDERLAAFLVTATQFMPFVADQGGGGVLTVTLDRKDVADLHATTVESVCRILKGLERSGLILLETPRRIRIPSLEDLAAAGRVARECDRPPCRTIARHRPVELEGRTLEHPRMTAVNAPHPPHHVA